MAEAIGHPEWVDNPELATRDQWAINLDTVIRPAIENWAADRTKLQASTQLCALGVAAGPSNEPTDVIGDPHVQSHHMLTEIPRPDGGDPLLIVGNPIKMSKLQEGPETPWPTLGRDTDAVLSTELGLTEEDLKGLRDRAAI